MARYSKPVGRAGNIALGSLQGAGISLELLLMGMGWTARENKITQELVDFGTVVSCELLGIRTVKTLSAPGEAGSSFWGACPCPLITATSSPSSGTCWPRMFWS